MLMNVPENVATSRVLFTNCLKNNITYNADILKIQLPDLIKKSKTEPVYEVDQLAEKYGRKVLRLPPYHCIFNPIENIWGMARNYYTHHVGETGCTIENAKSVWLDALNMITPDNWRNAVEHTEKEIQKWWDREVGIDQEEIGEFIIDVEEDYEP